MPKKEEKEKKKTKGMSSKNLKEHRSFYKWIKHYGAILIEHHKKLQELEERIKKLEERKCCQTS